MEKKLTKDTMVGSKTWYYDSEDNIIFGIYPGLSGDVSGLSGDVSGLSGDVDDCDITDDDRENGVNIADLIA